MIKHKVALEGMEFYAYHGFYEEERKEGNNFLVHVELETDFTKAALSDDISGTFNYEEIYKIVSTEMKISSKLLEHVAGRILDKLQAHRGTVFSIKVVIQKLNPPLQGKTACSVVEIAYKKK
jgi:dihydroneopterin aldolase